MNSTVIFFQVQGARAERRAQGRDQAEEHSGCQRHGDAEGQNRRIDGCLLQPRDLLWPVGDDQTGRQESQRNTDEAAKSTQDEALEQGGQAERGREARAPLACDPAAARGARGSSPRVARRTSRSAGARRRVPRGKQASASGRVRRQVRAREAAPP